MKKEIMNGVQGLSRGAKSNMKICREKAQNAQEKKPHFATLATFRGHSAGANQPVQLGSMPSNQSNWVKVSQTGLPGQASGRNRMEVPNNEQLAKQTALVRSNRV